MDVVVVDEPSDETWAMLGAIDLAGPRIWAATTTSSRPPSTGVFQFTPDISIRLGIDPHHRVELVTHQDQPVYWIENGEAVFNPAR